MHLATAGIASQPCSAQRVLYHRGPLHRLHPALQGYRCQRSRSQQDASLHRSVQCWGVCHCQGGSGCHPAGPAPDPRAPPGCCKLVSSHFVSPSWPSANALYHGYLGPLCSLQPEFTAYHCICSAVACVSLMIAVVHSFPALRNVECKPAAGEKFLCRAAISFGCTKLPKTLWHRKPS